MNLRLEFSIGNEARNSNPNNRRELVEVFLSPCMKSLNSFTWKPDSKGPWHPEDTTFRSSVCKRYTMSENVNGITTVSARARKNVVQVHPSLQVALKPSDIQ